jgi:hypothetical protein
LSTTSPPDTEPQHGRKVEKLAARLLRRSRLRPNPDVSHNQVASALARALAMVGPESRHGHLLVAALRPAAAPRPPGEWAVRMLLRYGQVPTPAAVVARIAQRDQHERAMVARAQAVAQRLGDGPAAAALVAKQWKAHGHGPTWHELGHRLGWPYRQVGPTVRALAAAGWLTPGTTPHSLRPGSRFDLDQAPVPVSQRGLLAGAGWTPNRPHYRV